MKDVIEDVDAWVARGDSVALATVIDVKRSAPRPPGAKMARTLLRHLAPAGPDMAGEHGRDRVPDQGERQLRVLAVRHRTAQPALRAVQRLDGNHRGPVSGHSAILPVAGPTGPCQA